MINFIFGMIVGAFFGLFIAALMYVAGEDDSEEKKNDNTE